MPSTPKTNVLFYIFFTSPKVIARTKAPTVGDRRLEDRQPRGLTARLPPSLPRVCNQSAVNVKGSAPGIQQYVEKMQTLYCYNLSSRRFTKPHA